MELGKVFNPSEAIRTPHVELEVVCFWSLGLNLCFGQASLEELVNVRKPTRHEQP